MIFTCGEICSVGLDKCVLLKDNSAVTLVKLEPAAPRSRVKHSTTELPVKSGNFGQRVNSDIRLHCSLS